jgi:hypothetical protein
MKRLIAIQQALKAPKDNRNSFGGYNYRSCEDILEAVKPLLEQQKLALVINDEIIAINGGFEVFESTNDAKNDKITDKKIIASNRVYIKATATLFDEEGKELVHSCALAREEEIKKGMDYSQLTGATSSYARKYALNGLFAIDDTKDSDATNKHGKDEAKKSEASFIPDVLKDDTDIYIGLSETTDAKSALKYFNEYKDKVQDKQAFTQAWKDRVKTLGGK